MILTAAWVVPVAAPPIRDGYVEVRGERIAAVGRARDLPAGAARESLGAMALLPGLVNAHTHLELDCYAGLIPPAPFWQWVVRLVPLRRAPGQRQREAAAVRAAAWKSLRAGVTCVGDISRLNLSWSELRTIPIRKVCFAELLTFADSPPRNPEELREALDAIEEDALLTAGVTPHAPYSVPIEQAAAAVALARGRGRPWTMHVAETREELAFLRGDRAGAEVGLRPLGARAMPSPHLDVIEYLDRIGGRDGAGALAHMNYLTDEQIERLAARRHTIVYCPRAHAFFGHAPHPLPRLLKAGVRVALGTDSPASNQNVHLLEELAHVATHVADAPSPAALLRMATLDAAAALGLGDRIGALAPGRFADLAAFDCPVATDDPVRALIEAPRLARRVWVGGTAVDWDAAPSSD